MERQQRKATTVSNASRNNLAKIQNQNCNYWSPLTSLVEELGTNPEYREVSEYKSKEEDNAAAAFSSAFLLLW